MAKNKRDVSERKSKDKKTSTKKIGWQVNVVGDLKQCAKSAHCNKENKKVKPITKKTVKKAAKKKPPRKKPKTVNKTRTDSISHNVDVAQAALREITPPDNIKLKENEFEYWDAIIAKFAKIEWDEHDLHIAAMLAINMSAAVETTRELERQGLLLDRKQIIQATKTTNAKVVVVGQYTNPLKGFVDMYNKNVIAFRRSLALHARGQDGEARDVAKRRSAAKQIENSFNDVDDDDLLARPKSLH